MDFSDNIHGFLASLPSKRRIGHVIFLATAAHLVGGVVRKEIPLVDVRKAWLKSVVKVAYNRIYYTRAQQKKWVNPVKKKGKNASLEITEIGLTQLGDIYSSEEELGTPDSDKLFVFEKKQAHSFDTLLRGVLANAKSKVWIADSYVDSNLFGRILSSVPKDIQCRMLYGQDKSPEKAFKDRADRFQKEWKKFQYKKYSALHDRFLVADDVGFILGPSIKDATDNSPALIVRLSRKESKGLTKFFNKIWQTKSTT